jgi:TonB family protein
MAYLYFIKNQLKEAAEEVKLALDQGARYPIIYMLKANLEMRDRKFDDALKSYEMALQLSQPLDGGYQKVSEQVELLKSYIAFQPLKGEFSAHKDDQAYKKPILKNRPQPLYSSLAREKKIQGIVHANIRVNEQGEPDAVLIVQGVGYGLDEEAIKAALRARFSPATRNGEPVKFWLIMLIEFNIR